MACEKLNEIYELLDGANDMGVRYVLDIGDTLNGETAGKCTAPPPKLATPTGAMSLLGGLGELCRLICSCNA